MFRQTIPSSRVPKMNITNRHYHPFNLLPKSTSLFSYFLPILPCLSVHLFPTRRRLHPSPPPDVSSLSHLLIVICSRSPIRTGQIKIIKKNRKSITHSSQRPHGLLFPFPHLHRVFTIHSLPPAHITSCFLSAPVTYSYLPSSRDFSSKMESQGIAPSSARNPRSLSSSTRCHRVSTTAAVVTAATATTRQSTQIDPIQDSAPVLPHLRYELSRQSIHPSVPHLPVRQFSHRPHPSSSPPTAALS